MWGDLLITVTTIREPLTHIITELGALCITKDITVKATTGGIVAAKKKNESFSIGMCILYTLLIAGFSGIGVYQFTRPQQGASMPNEFLARRLENLQIEASGWVSLETILVDNNGLVSINKAAVIYPLPDKNRAWLKQTREGLELTLVKSLIRDYVWYPSAAVGIGVKKITVQERIEE